MRDFASTWNNLLKHYISAEFLLIEGIVPGSLRKELLIAPFVDHLETATFGKSYLKILPIIRTIYLNIVFLPNFCWQKAKYKVFYEESCSLLLS